MPLADEVREQIEAFVKGRLAARALEGWLDSVADEIHSDDDPSLRQRVGQVYILLAELSYGDRTLENTQAEVAMLVGEASTAHVHGVLQSVGIITGSASIEGYGELTIGSTPSWDGSSLAGAPS